MTAQELRIGNWIFDRGYKAWQIDHWESINKVASKADIYMCMGVMTETHPLTEYVDYLKPIPLTEEWLLKFDARLEKKQFSLNVGGELFEYAVLNSKLVIYYDQKRGWTLDSRVDKNTHFFKYVHQLQNLYFALTGEELTIKEETK